MTSFQKYFEEMALSDIQKIGKWDNSKNRHGYDKQSIGILNSPKGWQKIQDKFNNINLADFNLYFVKDTGAWKTREVGKVDPERVKKEFGLDLSKMPDYDPDGITVVFTNNAAAEKVPLTPWTIAHRIGHGIYSTFRRQYGNRDGDYEFLNGKVEDAVLRILRNGYGIPDVNGVDVYRKHETRDLFENIGKFRSARMKKLPRTFEFIFECFAQYLFSNGRVSLNDLPAGLKTSNKKAWGHETGYTRRLKVDPATAEQYKEQLEYALENMFYYWVNSHKGLVSIM